MQYSIDKRPRLLREIKGQDSIINDLIKRQSYGKWPKAMLLKGKYGTGKTTTAMAIALALQCRNLSDVGEPCLECNSCRSIIEERYDRDTHMIDGSMLGQKDNVTEHLSLINISPMQDYNRIYIIEEANQLTTAAINMFHKILENPRDKLYFIFLTMDTGKKIPPSIQSRCQSYNFKPFTVKDTMTALKQIMIDDETWDDGMIPNSFRLEGLAAIANASKGSFRDAIQYLERCVSGGFFTPESIRENLGIVDENTILNILHLILDRDESVFSDINQLDPNEVYNLLLTLITDAYLYKFTRYVSNDYFRQSTAKLAGHKNFMILYNQLDSLRDSSKTYLRNSDLKSVIARYWDESTPSAAPARNIRQVRG